MALTDKEILDGLYNRGSVAKQTIIKASQDFEMIITAIKAFGGDPKRIDAIMINDNLDLFKELSQEISNIQEPEVIEEPSWKEKVVNAIVDLKIAAPPEIVQHIKKSDKTRTAEQIRKRVVHVLPQLEAEKLITHKKRVGTKSKYYELL